ncbi:MAG: hypothetical protein KDB74_01620 [Flavobacteriales bacterium]|nr:hypothetical protein [Flavobacteriales bacterium]
MSDKMTQLTFNFDYVINGWFERNFYKISQNRFIQREGDLYNFSTIWKFDPTIGDLETFVLVKE